MAHFIADPALEPGDTALVGKRTVTGAAYAWTPGGDADAYVAHVGPEHFAVFEGRVFQRAAGALYPHEIMREPHIAIRPVAGDPIFIRPNLFTAEYAVLADLPDTDALDATIATLREQIAERDARIAVLEDDLVTLADEVLALRGELELATGDAVAVDKNDTPEVPQTPESGESSQEPGEVPSTTPPAPGDTRKRKPKAATE